MYDRVLSTLLNELDGVEARTGVTLLAATSKPDDLDSVGRSWRICEVSAHLPGAGASTTGTNRRTYSRWAPGQGGQAVRAAGV